MKRHVVALGGALLLLSALAVSASAAKPVPAKPIVQVLPTTTLTDGGSAVIYAAGPLTFTAQCFANVYVPPWYYAHVEVATTQDHAAFWPAGGILRNADLLVTGNVGETTVVEATGSGAPALGSSTFTALAPDGTRFTATMFAGVNILGVMDQCQFGGTIEGGP